MKENPRTDLPETVTSVSLALVPLGIAIGALYGLNVISILTLDLIFFIILALFVPFAVLKLDPGRLRELSNKLPEK